MNLIILLALIILAYLITKPTQGAQRVKRSPMGPAYIDSMQDYLDEPVKYGEWHTGTSPCGCHK